MYKSSDYSVLLRMHPTNPTVSGGSDIGTHPGSKGDQKSEDDPVKEDVASSKSVMIIMIVAPVCAGVAFIIISCILLVWYMRYVYFL